MKKNVTLNFLIVRKITLFICLIFTTNKAYSQFSSDIRFECITRDMDIDQVSNLDKGLDCSEQSDLYNLYYSRYKFFNDYYDIRPTVTIPVNIVIWQDGNGENNWVKSDESIARIKNIIAVLNAHYSDVETSSDPIEGVALNFSSTKIQFELKHVLFFKNQEIWDANISQTKVPLKKYFYDIYPQYHQEMNLHINGAKPDPNQSFQGYIGNVDANGLNHSYVVSDYNEPGAVESGGDWGYAKHLAHEIGHILSIMHTYFSPGQGQESCDQNNLDYLDDVFGSGNNSNCPHAKPNGSLWGCDPWASDNECTNNLMGGTSNNRYLSPKQIFRMQRTLSITPVRRYVKHEDYGQQVAIEITKDELWDFDIKLYNPIFVKNGATLTISCKLLLGKNHTITVEPGAKLVIDGGTITCDSDGFWQGIIVLGNSTKPQLPQYQGVVVMNNSTIENAKEALRFWEPNNYGTTGGFVNAYNTTFRNNWRSAEFIYYHNNTGQGEEIKHRALFNNCIFTWDNEYYNEEGIAPAITMYHTNGININACHFEDQRSAAILDPSSGATGVGGLDASFNVLGNRIDISPFGPFPAIGTVFWYDDKEYNPTTFKNMRIGVHASNATSLAQAVVDECRFDNVHFGVTMNSVDNAFVTRNLFNYPGRNGVILDDCSDYTIEGNEFNSLINNEKPKTGILTRNSGTESNDIYRNNFEGFDYGNVAQGVNSNDDPSIDKAFGLEWNCDKNAFGRYDFVVSQDQLAPVEGQGVKLFQGTPSEAAGNTFTKVQGNSTLVFHIFNEDVNNLNYYRSTGGQETPTQTSNNISVFNAELGNTCISDLQLSGLPYYNGFAPQDDGGLVAEIQAVTDEIKLRNKLLHIQLQLGDKTELHDLVSSLNKTNRIEIRDALMAASPFLSEKLLRKMGEKPSSEFPHQWYKDLVLANAEIARSKQFIGFLKNKPEAMPEGLYLEIMNKRNQLTERGRMELDILNLKTERSKLTKRLINDRFGQQEKINWNQVEDALIKREHALMRLEEVDFNLGQGKKSAAQTQLNTLETEMDGMESPWNQRSAQDFVIVKNYIMTLLNEDGALLKLDANQKANLEYMAENFVGRGAQQAQNILCFFEGNCDFPEVKEPKATPKNANATDKSLATETITSNEVRVQITPNPSAGVFEVQTPAACLLQEARIYDAAGTEIEFTKSGSGQQHRFEVMAIRTGIYILELHCDDRQVFRERMLLIK